MPNSIKNKHYIRIDKYNYVVYAFSDAFEQASVGDICIEENGDRQLVINGQINPSIFDTYGLPIYKYINNQIEFSPKSETAEFLKQKKATELELARDAIVYGTFQYNGKTFDCDSKAMDNINKLIAAYNINPNLQGRSWNTSGGTEVVILTTEDIPKFIAAYISVTDNAWGKYSIKMQQLNAIDLNASNSKELINTITW